jgi:hypothetical protein
MGPLIQAYQVLALSLCRSVQPSPRSLDLHRLTVDLDFVCFNSIAGAQQPADLLQISESKSPLSTHYRYLQRA